MPPHAPAQATLGELTACGVPQMIETLATLQRAANAAAAADPYGDHAKAQQKLVDERRMQLAQVCTLKGLRFERPAS